MVAVRIYVEGGGDRANLKSKCRAGFRMFLEKVFPMGTMPRIIACGSRRDTYDRFCTALNQYPDDFCVLLVDSEAPVVDNFKPWKHLKNRPGDEWKKPGKADDNNTHLMVQCMEAWFLADKECLAEYFGQGFNENALPSGNNIETISKNDIFKGLKSATRYTKTKGKYGKGSHSFEILAKIDPGKVCAASPHADFLFKSLAKQLR